MKPLSVTKTTPLLVFLEASFPKLSRTEIKRFLKFEAVRVNGRAVRQFDFKLKPGDDVRVLTAGETRGIESLGRVRIVFEDSEILVADKPPGLLTVSTETEKERTLYFRLNRYLKEKANGRERIFVVHRLDREVSGLLLFAKTEAAKLTLQNNWDRFTKLYSAVLEGAPPESSGSVRNYLSEDRFGNVTSSNRPSRGCKEAVTHYRTIRSSQNYSLLEIELETGRKNQIRVHMADLGCPIAGDGKYGAQTDPIQRLALHAAKLRFDHPVTRESMTFELPIPGPFESVLSGQTFHPKKIGSRFPGSRNSGRR